jgi:chromosome segregation ATPase
LVASEARFDRIENQIGELRAIVQQGFTVVQQDIAGLKQDVNGMKQDIAGLKQDVTEIQQDIAGLKQDVTGMQQDVTTLGREEVAFRQRIDSVEGTLLVAIRDGFKAQSDYADDLNYDLANNERKTRRLSRRVARLERAGED